MTSKYILKSEKAIEFYNKNPHIDFDNINDLFVDMIQKLTSTVQSTISVNELKVLLRNISVNMKSIDDTIASNNQISKMTYDIINNQKEFYVNEMKNIIENKDENNSILTTIRETNQSLLDKTMYTLLEQYPKLNETMTKDLKQLLYLQQNEIIKENQRTFSELLDRQDKTNDNSMMEKIIQDSYQGMYTKIHETMNNYYDKISETNHSFQTIGKDFQIFLEKQKNSTLKGKESEEKLENCLVTAFSHAEIINQSGKPQSCDYLMVRNEKPDILFENKDYTNNVPNEEIKKFIRDIEYQKKHGILLSQHSGVTQKYDYQIDIHDGNIMVYVHFVKYDESKIRVAVNIIDHLHNIIESSMGDTKGMHISMEDLGEINKEYLTFIGQKKSLIEITKKMHNDQLKAIENFEMPKLTALLNSKFTNVEQLTYKCEICGKYSAKNKRALTTHQNKCRKKMMKLQKMKLNEENIEDLNDIVQDDNTENNESSGDEQ